MANELKTELETMLLLLDVQVMQDENKILCLGSTLKQYDILKAMIIEALKDGVEIKEGDESILELRQRFWFWGALVDDDLVQSKKA